MRLGSWLARRRRPETAHISLGTFCHAADALRQAGLRRWSGPFDWIFSTPAMTASCLRDGCAALLDPAALHSVPPDASRNGARKQARHPAFETRYGLPAIFNHHDPVGSSRDRATLRRAATRLDGALRGSGRNRFYCLSEVHWPQEEIADLAGALASFPARSSLVVITALGGEARQRRTELRRDPGRCPVVQVELGTLSRSGGLRFRDPADDAFLGGVLRDLAAEPF